MIVKTDLGVFDISDQRILTAIAQTNLDKYRRRTIDMSNLKEQIDERIEDTFKQLDVASRFDFPYDEQGTKYLQIRLHGVLLAFVTQLESQGCHDAYDQVLDLYPINCSDLRDVAQIYIDKFLEKLNG